MGATIDELEGAMLLLEGNEQELIETRNQAGSRLNLLLQILADSEIQFQDGPET
jgi:hypothetical protein